MPPAPLSLPKLAKMLAVTLTAACTQFPELDAVVSDAARNAPEPELVDHRQIVGDALEGDLTLDTQTALQSRATALQSQASALNGPVLDETTRQELESASERLKGFDETTVPES